MPTNKHATIRYHALDRCFSNFGRRFYIEDLIEACNEALYEFAGIEDGVKRRQVYDDMTYMESEQGWSVPLERIKDGRRKYYRYEDRNFSIKNMGINPSEAEQLKETLSILSRFKGLPQFDWVEEMQIRLEDTFHLKGTTTAVSFEQNPDLKGLNQFTELFNAIQNQIALKITYKSFKEHDARCFVFHPWHLKQYNNRWFVFGWNDVDQKLFNLAIDRIMNTEQNPAPYKKNKHIDFDEFFEDVVGVSVDPDSPAEKVIVKINKDLWPYIESKPIHGSQKVKERAADYILIELTLQMNYELVSQILSYGEKVKIIKPNSLIDMVKIKIKGMFENYF